MSNAAGFNPVDYFSSRGIEFWTKGKNVGRGWVNIQCPFCGDSSNHLGVNLESGLFSCWLCSEKGGPEKLIRAVESCTWGEARALAIKHGAGGEELPERQTKAPGAFAFPKGASKIIPGLHRQYLAHRGFNPASIIRDYKLMATSVLADKGWAQRLICPVFLDREPVAYIGADVTRKSKMKYKASATERSALPLSECLYNIDSVFQTKGVLVLVEGVTDVWRIGPGAAALFTKRMSEAQKRLLLNYPIRRAFVMLDADAQPEAEKIAEDLSALVKDVNLLELDKGDPADLSLSAAKDLRRRLLL